MIDRERNPITPAEWAVIAQRNGTNLEDALTAEAEAIAGGDIVGEIQARLDAETIRNMRDGAVRGALGLPITRRSRWPLILTASAAGLAAVSLVTAFALSRGRTEQDAPQSTSAPVAEVVVSSTMPNEVYRIPQTTMGSLLPAPQPRR